MQLNMLEAMNIYVNVVEQGSFIRAAEVLELHRPAVTRAVQNLEHDLGVKLLHRTTRQVSMTDEGEEFYQRCLSLLNFPPPPKPVSLLYPDRRYLAPKVRVFIDWLCEVFGPDAHL
ncbi:LysR family transcriptional regulator [Salmonella enterica subsp. enterica]|nr:LysR family transcriptional regulator [Salmonella enterica subsp. enterica]